MPRARAQLPQQSIALPQRIVSSARSTTCGVTEARTNVRASVRGRDGFERADHGDLDLPRERHLFGDLTRDLRRHLDRGQIIDVALAHVDAKLATAVNRMRMRNAAP